MSLPPSPTKFTLAEARDAVRARQISARELTAAFLSAVEGARRLNAFITEAPEKALEMIAESDRRIAGAPAFAIGEKPAGPASMFLNDVFTINVNLAGLPGLAAPVGLAANGLPLGLRIIGKAFDEEAVLRMGCAIERAAGFGARPEAWWSAK